MKKRNSKLESAAMLRQKAEEKLRKRKSQVVKSVSDVDKLKLIHELEVHQVELELQNEELRTAKEKAEKAEEKYTDLYDFAPSGYLSLTKEGEILNLNFTAARMLGKERSKLINSRFAIFLSINTRPDFNRFLERTFASIEKQTCDVIIEIKGNPVPKESSSSITYVTINGIVSQDGEFCRLTVVDITTRKKGEEELVAAKEKAEVSEVKFRSLFNRVADAIFIYDPDTLEILEANEATSEMYGYKRDELTGMSVLKFSAEVEKSKSAALKIERTGEVDVKLRHHKKKDGKDLIVELRGYKIVVNNKPVTFAVCHDITEAVKSEQELKAALEKAQESDRLKSAFLANMSHEIRTPMNGILGFAGLLKEPGLTGGEQQKYIGVIEKSGIRMLNIINQIIDISKIEAGMMELNIKKTNVNEQIEYNYTFFRPEAEAKGIKLSYKNPLPANEATIKTDREKLYAILANLVKNALKYTEKGSIELGYSLKTDNKPHELRFYVKDTGVGILKNRQEAIFERFIQADIMDKMAYQGAGLGLAISKAYVEMLGGKIWVESENGKGSSFYFTLPYNTEPNAEIYRQPKAFEKNEAIKKLKILIAEDDEVSVLLLNESINVLSKEILNAGTGVEAIAKCRDNPGINLILMDVRMPEMGGYEATKQIREFDKEVIIIAQTAYGLAGDRQKAIDAGCNDYISKPIKKAELQVMIHKYFN